MTISSALGRAIGTWLDGKVSLRPGVVPGGIGTRTSLLKKVLIKVGRHEQYCMYRCCLAGHIFQVLGEVLVLGNGGPTGRVLTGCHLRVIKDTCVPVGCTISSQEDGRVECLMLGRVIDAMVFFVDKVGI